MNRQTQFNHLLSFSLQILNGFGQGDLSSEPQTLTRTALLNNPQEPIKLPDHETEAVPQQLDDLSAVIQKCNGKGFENSFLSVDRPAFSIPAVAAHRPGFLYHSQDFMRADNKPRVQSLTKGWILKNGGGREEEESLKRKRSIASRSPPSLSPRENHIISERQKRGEMNELFAQMRSLLPNQTAKSDKASIVTETIKYIQSLQRTLAIHSKKHATMILPNQADGTADTIKSEAMSSVPKAHQNPCSKCDKSTCSKHWEENLTVKYNGKDIFITIDCANKELLLPSIILAVETRDMQVMDAFVSNTERVAFLCLHVKAAQMLDTVAREALSGTLSKLINSEFQINFNP